jgi:hypothetical protein
MSFGVDIRFTGNSSAVPDLARIVEEGHRDVVRRVAEGVRSEVERELGAGPMGKSFRLVDVVGGAIELRSKHPGARAQDVGAVIRPRHAKVLRFESGGRVTYTRGPVVIRPKRYVSHATRHADRYAGIASRDLIAALGQWEMQLTVGVHLRAYGSAGQAGSGIDLDRERRRRGRLEYGLTDREAATAFARGVGRAGAEVAEGILKALFRFRL